MNLAAALAEALLATRADAIIVADRDGVIQFWNPGAERLFGHSADEALGRSLDLIIPDRLRERHWQGYGKVMATGQSRYGESDLRRCARTALRFQSSSPSCRCTTKAAD